MEDMLNNLKSRANGVALTAEEKSAGREALRSFMALTPNRSAQAVASKPSRFGFLRMSYVGRAAGVFAASFALLLSAGGISYAAEGAVPGDTLYPVKVSVSEPLRAAMSVSEKDRAEWSAERASRRLAEAEVLARRGTLRAETRVALDADFQRFSEGAELHLANVKQEDGDGVAADVGAHIEGTLRAHSQIMVALAEDRRQQREQRKADTSNDQADNNDEDDDRQVAALVASVDHQVDAAVKVSDTAEARVSSDESGKAAGFARGRHDVAVKKIAEVRSWLAAKAGKFTPDSQAQAKARLSAADAAVAEGDAALSAGKNREAFAAYAKAQRLAQEAKLIVRASNDLKVRVRFQESAGVSSGKKQDGKEVDGDVKVHLDAGVRLNGLLGGQDNDRSGESGDNHSQRGSRDN